MPLPSSSSSSPLPPAIPPSSATVSVSIIDNGARIGNIKTSALFENPIPGHDAVELPSYAFLIEHKKSGAQLLFDLGLREDWEEGTPKFVTSYIKDFAWTITSPSPSFPSLPSILSPSPSAASSSPPPPTAILLSHHHWDHTGSPSLFPPSIPLIVGPGFKRAFFPGYPSDPSGQINSAAWTDPKRDVIELDFSPSPSPSSLSSSSSSTSTPSPRPEDTTFAALLTRAPRLEIGGLQAIDVFGDGSFYVLDAPGHTVGHVCALARTGPSHPPLPSPSVSTIDSAPDFADPSSEFILLGGDALHHPAELRPNVYSPLSPSVLSVAGYKVPETILARTRASNSSSPDHNSDCVQPFYIPHAHDVSLARDTLAKLGGLDVRDDVLTLGAHERGLDGRVEMWPGRLEGWRERGVRGPLFWEFLRDFEGAGGG